MFEQGLNLEGKYTKAFVTTSDVEQECISQIIQLINHPAFYNPVAVMPDCHAGKGCVIGFTMPLTKTVCPNIIGVDIGCGMLGTKYSSLKLDREEVDKAIRKVIPFGTEIRKSGNQFDLSEAQILMMQSKLDSMWMKLKQFFGNDVTPAPRIDMKWYQNLCAKIGMNFTRAQKSIGTLGGGRDDCLQTERQ